HGNSSSWRFRERSSRWNRTASRYVRVKSCCATKKMNSWSAMRRPELFGLPPRWSDASCAACWKALWYYRARKGSRKQKARKTEKAAEGCRVPREVSNFLIVFQVPMDRHTHDVKEGPLTIQR